MGRLAVSCVVLLAASIPGFAAAQEPSPEVIEQARVLYEDGANFYRSGRYLEAEMNFRRVHNLLRAPSVLFDLALAQEKQKKWGEAAANFEIFMRDSTRVARREMIEKRVERLRELQRRARKPSVGPELGPPEEELELDSGEAVPQTPAEPPSTPPGPPEPSAPAPAVTPPGAAPAAATPAAPAKPAPEPEKSQSRWWVWAVVGGAAVTAIAVGVGVGLGANGGPAPGTPTDFEFTYGALRSGGLAVESGVLPLVRF